MASNLVHKLQYTVTSSSQVQSISGNDPEGCNAEFPGPIPQTFAAGSSDAAISGWTGFVAASLTDVFIIANQDCTITTNGASPVADVQTISIAGTPTGGDFALVFNGAATILPYNATASQVQTALQSLSTIGSGNITCTGGPLPGTAVVCTFSGTKAAGKQALMATYSGSLTGGSSPTASVAHTTPGLPSDTINLVAGIPLVWGVSGGYYPCPITANVTSAYMTCANSTQLRYQIGTN